MSKIDLSKANVGDKFRRFDDKIVEVVNISSTPSWGEYAICLEFKTEDGEFYTKTINGFFDIAEKVIP